MSIANKKGSDAFRPIVTRCNTLLLYASYARPLQIFILTSYHVRSLHLPTADLSHRRQLPSRAMISSLSRFIHLKRPLFFIFDDGNFHCRQLPSPIFVEVAMHQRKLHHQRLDTISRITSHTDSHSLDPSKHKWLIDHRGPEGKGRKQEPMVGPRNSQNTHGIGIRGTYIKKVFSSAVVIRSINQDATYPHRPRTNFSMGESQMFPHHGFHSYLRFSIWFGLWYGRRIAGDEGLS